jgi:DNA helicase-2/ATP-dependent DNA helicase PcrA
VAVAAAAGERPNVAGYLERVTLVSDADAIDDTGRVILMTVHGAKGLEFERVLLTGMEEEMFPYKGVDPGESEELEEERRLAYVAITRARKELVMTHTRIRQIFGTTRWNRPSRFLGELPKGAVEHQATVAMAKEGQVGRYVDREEAAPPSPPPARTWHHPQAASAREVTADPGERYVDHEFFDDHASDVTDMPLRRGARVKHDRFGEGQVVGVARAGEPAVVAFFPGWGEKKILARFLKPAG